jgi:7-cyano-7-deazaguanine reductase
MNDDSLSASPLGKQSASVFSYTPSLLHPIPRAVGREALGLRSDALPFQGLDVWTLYELSWLDAGGKPQNAMGQLQVPCDSPYLVESKSLKLYLGSFSQSVFTSIADVSAAIERDLSALLCSPVDVSLYEGANTPALTPTALPGECIDSLAITTDCYTPDPSLLQRGDDEIVEEDLYSDLFRSLCPVTGQPDWASVCIAYRGPAIDHQSLLKYLVSYREHAGFHEQCVEQIFVDIQSLSQPELLIVYARYLRRGGLDINPYRSSSGRIPLLRRLIRQ